MTKPSTETRRDSLAGPSSIASKPKPSADQDRASSSTVKPKPSMGLQDRPSGSSSSKLKPSLTVGTDPAGVARAKLQGLSFNKTKPTSTSLPSPASATTPRSATGLEERMGRPLMRQPSLNMPGGSMSAASEEQRQRSASASNQASPIVATVPLPRRVEEQVQSPITRHSPLSSLPPTGVATTPGYMSVCLPLA